MLTFYLAAAMLLVVVCTGGRLARLADVRIRHSWLLWLALADQIVIISVVPDSHRTVLAVAHIASYVLAGACVVLNLRLPGVWLIGLGGALNGLVITVNGGTLPTSAAALRAAGRAADADQFTNSGVVESPRLAFLGDAFATPAWLPGHSVFSVGDVLIWAGIAWFLWRTCRQPDGRSRGGSHRRRAQGGRHARPVSLAPVSPVFTGSPVSTVDVAR